MAEADGITLPAAQPSGLRRPLSPPPSEPLPVESAVFEAIHRFNSRCERLLHDFRNLQAVPYFAHEQLTAWQRLFCRIQAEANFHFAETIKTRTGQTAAYFDRLCAQSELETADSDAVRIEAVHRNTEQSAQEQQEEPAT